MSSITANLTKDDAGLWVCADEESVSYPEGAHDLYFEIEEASFWIEHRKNCALRLLKKWPPGDFICDVGGSNGYMAKNLQDAGYGVCLVEPGRKASLNAKRRGVRTVVNSGFETARFPEGSISSVSMFDTLEHIDDDERFLKNVHRTLKSGGRLYITVPAYPHLWSQDDVYAKHFRRYSRGGLSALFTKTGYEVEFSSYIFSFLYPAVLAARTIPRLLGRREALDNIESLRRVHMVKKGIARRIVDLLMQAELAAFDKGLIPFGTSCVVVARKI